MADQFLPESYELPKSGGQYMKFKQGSNNFRFLSSPIVGYVYWIDEADGSRKPVRVKTLEEVDRTKINKKNPVKHFWSAVVYNYATKQVEILEITQKGILEGILNYVNSPSWGSPKSYDLIVKREGEGLETKYAVMAEPKVALAAGIRDQFEKSNINLEALWTNDNPFGDTGTVQVTDDEINIDDLNI